MAYTLFLVVIVLVSIPVLSAFSGLVLLAVLALLILLAASVLLLVTASFPVYLAEATSHIPLFSVAPNIKSEESITASTHIDAAGVPEVVPRLNTTSVLERSYTDTSTSEATTIMRVSFAQKARTMFYVEQYDDIYLASVLIGVIFGIIFGSIHFCALGTTFPSRGEYITWIIASGYTVLPFVGLIISWIWDQISKIGGFLMHWAGKTLQGLLGLVQHEGSRQCLNGPGRWLQS